jgi:2,2-dialkylglycine decarboxylase (pyruvate)
MIDQRKSLELWEKYGDYLLLAMPYADGLITEASGCVLRDADGNELLDLAAGQFCSLVGHNHPKLIERIIKQTRKVLHVGTEFLSPVVLEAAEKFARVAPGNLKKSLFLSTGTEANECAIGMAKLYTGKTGIVGFDRGYYGLSLAAKSLSSIFAQRHHPDSSPLVPGSYRILAPHCFHCPVRARYPECNLLCLETSIRALLGERDDIAAIIVEPILSAGGMIVPPPGYLKALKDLAKEREALLIVDEAQTGFGRTGKWFGIEHHEVEPDILVVSKSAGGGFPVSAVITSDRIANRVVQEGFAHLASHQSDPVAAAAVAAVIDVVAEEGLVERAAEMGAYFLARLRELQAKHPIIADVRGQGLMLGMEIAADSQAGSDASQLALLICGLCKQNGVHFTYTYFEPVFRFIPPLTITRGEIDRAVQALDDAIATALSGRVSLDQVARVNAYARSYAENTSGKKTLARIARRLYETSPAHWMKKLAEITRK